MIGRLDAGGFSAARVALALAVPVFVAGAEPREAAGQRTTPDKRSAAPRTPWGDPDLQGLWNHGTNTPLQRPPKHAEREWLTDEETAAANHESATFATSERRSDLSPLYDLSLNYNQFSKNFRVQADYLGSGLDRHVVERFTRRSGDVLEYSATVTDPSIWTRPWTMTVPWRAAEGPLFEYACHEGNYSMTNLLSASRAVEAGR